MRFKFVEPDTSTMRPHTVYWAFMGMNIKEFATCDSTARAIFVAEACGLKDKDSSYMVINDDGKVLYF